MDKRFSVLISVYAKERAAYFEECLESILAQTVLPNEIVIVEDGPLTAELNSLLDKYDSLYPQLFRRISLKENQGLGRALAQGVPVCSYELIARMDSDDIARQDRFEKQLEEFEKDKELDICGSHIIEFSGNVSNMLSMRKVPLTHEEIRRYQRRRAAFNHVTVMFRKSAVLRAGNYQDAPLMEDDYLWVRMLLSGAKCKNIDDCLVYVRAGDGLMARRGGYQYLKKYQAGRKKILQTGFITYWDYFVTSVVQFVVALLPQRIRAYVFNNLLRNKV